MYTQAYPGKGIAGKTKPDNINRCFVIHSDESREQTERIFEYQKKKRSLNYLERNKSEIEKIINTHKAAQKLSRNIPVVNDFLAHLSFPVNHIRSRIAYELFLDLIDCVCFLRQYQKKEEKTGDIRFIRCDLEDYRTAYNIMIKTT